MRFFCMQWDRYDVLSKIVGGKKREIAFHFGRWCFNLFIESVLIIGGTLGRYGSTSIENIDDFFSTIANLSAALAKSSPLDFPSKKKFS